MRLDIHHLVIVCMYDTVQTLFGALPQTCGMPRRQAGPPGPSTAIHQGATIKRSNIPLQNQLLAALPEPDLQRWLPLLELSLIHI